MSALRRVVLSGELSEFAASSVQAQLLSLASADAHAPIEVLVGVTGGDLRAALALADTLRFLPAPTRTVALGALGLAGVLVLATGHHRVATAHAAFDLRFAPQDGGALWPAMVRANEAVLLRERVAETPLNLTQIEDGQLARLLRGGETLSAQDAFAHGLVDEVRAP